MALLLAALGNSVRVSLVNGCREVLADGGTSATKDRREVAAWLGLCLEQQTMTGTGRDLADDC
ncbi:MAG: hypothetical protein M3R24_09060 [Chloroflexota bacterium]|nr:hypothetical protein [Chloroflexota bacterium]